MDPKPAVAPSSTSSVKKEGGGRRQQRFKQWGKQQHAPHQASPPSTLKVLKGKTEVLEDCIFDLGTANQAEILI